MTKRPSKKQSKPEERREHVRVPVASDWGEVQPLLGATLHWPNHETSQVFDISYFGVATGKPALFEVKIEDAVQIQMDLGEETSLKLNARVAWGTDKVVGLRLDPLGIDERQALDEFLEDRLIGINLRRIDRRHFGSFDFSVWYHGPNDTNVFLWTDLKTDRILKAEIELDGRVLIFDGAELLTGGARPRSITDEIGSGSVDEAELPAVASGSLPIVKRALAILAQVDERRGPMRDFLALLVKAAQ